jgi:hypothetical protein
LRHTSPFFSSDAPHRTKKLARLALNCLLFSLKIADLNSYKSEKIKFYSSNLFFTLTEQYTQPTMRTLVCLIFFIVFFTQCDLAQQPTPQVAEVAELQKQTETIHDAAMKDLADMNRRGRALKALAASETTPKAYKTAIMDTLSRMQAAETVMYDWMRGYTPPPVDTPVAEAKAYLENQKSQITDNAAEIHALLK